MNLSKVDAMRWYFADDAYFN